MGVYENARRATKEKIISAFWELYKEKPMNRITVKELTDVCGIGRGTFYLHFQDVYAVIEDIEDMLYQKLEQMDELIKNQKSSMIDFNRILYECCGDEKELEYISILVLERRDPFYAQKYLHTLKEYLMEVCIDDGKLFKNGHDRALIDITLSSMTEILLSCVCCCELSIDETNELIMGLMQNGYYITLTNKFGIDMLNNPFKYL